MGGAEANDVSFRLIRAGAYYRVSEGAPASSEMGVAVGSRCRRPANLRGFVCAAAGVEHVVADLGRGDDELVVVGALNAPVRYSGGAGFDTVIYIPDKGAPRPIRMTADGVANDGVVSSGRRRWDNIGTDVEHLFGGAQDDRLAAGPHSSVLNGGPGQDTQIGGPGDDELQAAYVETVEEIFFTDEGQDTLVCGGGRDSVFAGPSDSVAADCEVVLRQRTVQTPSTPDPLCSEFAGCGAYQFEWRGSNDRDTIANDRFVIRPARILGRGGDDRLTVGKASPDALFGGSGDDILHGQRGSAINYLDGGSGRDTLLTRDRAQDLVHCGAGRDTAYVDSLDAVADDCERVRR